MSFIEGVGDEVTVVSILFLIIIFVVTVLSLGSIFSTLNALLLPYCQGEQLLSDESAEAPQVQNTNNTTVTEQSSPGADDVAATEDIVNVNTDASEDNADAQTDDSAEASPDQPLPEACLADDASNKSASENEDEEIPEEEHAVPPNVIRVRLKYLNDTERTVTAEPAMKVKEFKRNHFMDDISNRRTVRLIFNGRLLLDNKTLSECGIVDGTVVHVHVSSTPTPQQAATNADSSLDLSNMFMPLFAVMLGVCWVSYLHYPQYFNMATISLLIIFSLSFLIACTHSSVEAS